MSWSHCALVAACTASAWASTSPRAASTTRAASRCTRRCSPTRPTAATRPATSSAIYTAPEGKTVDDPAFKKKILDNLAQVEKDHPDQILRSIGYFKSPDVLKNMADADKQHAFMSIQLKGDNDDAILNNYQARRGRPAQGQTTASTSSWPACSRWPAS